MSAQDPDDLVRAAFYGDLDSVRVQIEAGANINASGLQWNPLHAAIENQQTEVVAYLLMTKADPNYTNGDNFSPLHHAIDIEIDAATQEDDAELPQPVLTRLLVESGANLSIIFRGQTPLQMAIARGHKYAVEYLHRQGAI